MPQSDCYAMASAGGRNRLTAPRAIFGVPVDATQAERNALLTAAADARLGEVKLVAEPLAAAMGAGLPVEDPPARWLSNAGREPQKSQSFPLEDFVPLGRSASAARRSTGLLPIACIFTINS